MFPRLTLVSGLLLSIWLSDAKANPLGTLVRDGPPTPEQISLYLPVTGNLTSTVAAVKYRPKARSSWLIAHPLHRIQTAYTPTTVADAFAGVITGLLPSTDYTVEVTVMLDDAPHIQTLSTTTRALPPEAPTPTKIITARSTSAKIQTAFDRLSPGDVLQFENGTYDIQNLQFNRRGTDTQPIYVRGASRKGVILRDPKGQVIQLLNSSNVIIEDLTIEGSGIDSGPRASSVGIRLGEGRAQRRVTIRRITMRGVDQAVVTKHHVEQLLVYDCTFTGNNSWTRSFIDTNITWNDDGIRVPGHGNAIFNNTLYGFGDALAVQDGIESVAVHFYRNDILMTGDDAFEGDYGYRNLTFYDNRVHNSMTLVSFDPLRGGPAFVFRNVAINIGRSPYKFNNTNTGHFVYNNTVVRTNGSGSHANWGWIQFNNGPQRAWGYRNNILIFRGAGSLFAMRADGQDPIDFTNNAWYPNEAVRWNSTGDRNLSISSARTELPATRPVFGTSTQRHENDVITEADPFIEDIRLGSTYITEIKTLHTPVLAPDTAPRATGAVIPGITDGFRGSAPDMGAIITGVEPPSWGPREPRESPSTNFSPTHSKSLMVR